MTVGSGVRVGAAAALALGLSLAGPQAVGVATAESGDGDASAAVSARPERAEAAPRGVGREARAAGVTGAAAVARPAAAAESGVPRGAAAVGSAVVVPAPAAASSESASSSTAVVGARAVKVPAAAVSTHRAAVVSGGASEVDGDVPTAASDGPEDWAQGVADTVAQWQYDVEAVLADPVGSIQAALDTGVNTVFDTLTDWLSGLPPNPIADYFSGALLLVRRALFDQVQPPETFTNVLLANGQQWVGTLNSVDPWDEALTFVVTDAPDHGSVQINPDGTYTYTPDEGYTGPDSFIVQVNDPGFDLLDPFSSRVQAVTATVDTSIATAGATFLYPRITNVGEKNAGELGIRITRTLYTIDKVRGTRQRVDNTLHLVPPGATYFVNNYYPDKGVRPPGPGVYFEYRLDITSSPWIYTNGRDSRYVQPAPLWTIDFTQEAGSSNTSTKVSLDLPEDLRYLLKRYGYEIVDITNPGSSNSTQQVQLVWRPNYSRIA